MSYMGKTAEIFSLGFLPSVSRTAGCARGFNVGKCWITHEASLPHFLLFCNQLSPKPFPLRPLGQSLSGLNCTLLPAPAAARMRRRAIARPRGFTPQRSSYDQNLANAG
jgi:hypothetical protein